jgi:hypothetical protein
MADLEVRKGHRRPRQGGVPWTRVMEPMSSLFAWYSEHRVLGSLFVALYLVCKGFAMSRGNITTSLGILDTAGVTTIVVGGLVSGLPPLVGAMLGIAVFRLITEHPSWEAGRPRREDESRWRLLRPSPEATFFPAAFLAACLIMPTLVFTPTLALIAAVVLGAGLGAVERTRPRKILRPGTRRPAHPRWWLFTAVATWTLVILVGLYTVANALHGLWLPHEVIAFHDARTPRVGYVLSDSDGWMSMLTTGDHQIVRFRDADVASRTTCEAGVGSWGAIGLTDTPWQYLTRLHGLGSFSALDLTPCHPTAPSTTTP